MATETIGTNLGPPRLAGADKGVSLSTTADFVPLIRGTRYVELIPRNFATAVVLRYLDSPYLVVLRTNDALLSSIIDYSDIAQDGSTSSTVDMTSLPTLANGGALWIGSYRRFRGVDIDVNVANAAANNLTVHYPTAGSLTLTDISDTDNTDTGASLAQDGTVTWTVPASNAWVAASLRDIAEANALVIKSARFKYDGDQKLYWTRWTWNAAMDSSPTLNHMLGMNESTAYANSPVGSGLGQMIDHRLSERGIGAYELLVDAGTGNCIVNCYAFGGRFPDVTGTVQML